MTRTLLICDDDPVQLDELTKLFKECPPWHQWPIQCFSSIQALLAHQDNFSPGSILLMDICLEDGNGIDAVAQLQVRHPEIDVIYITGEISYCTEVYDTKHCGFLVKPFSLSKLQRALRRTCHGPATTRSLTVRVGRNAMRIPLDDIFYFEKQLRKMLVVTRRQIIDFYGKFEDLEAQLDRRMLQCHRSFVVNMDHIEQLADDHFLLGNKKSVPISRRKLTQVRNAFLRYLQEKNKSDDSNYHDTEL